MKKNIGRFDQLLRIGISAGLIYIGFIDGQIVHDRLSANIIGTIGILNLIVALVRFCPLYIAAGINTCDHKSK